VSQVLTLFTTPVIYLGFDRLARRWRGRSGGGQGAASAPASASASASAPPPRAVPPGAQP
jgi:multidrug efflux pump